MGGYLRNGYDVHLGVEPTTISGPSARNGRQPSSFAFRASANTNRISRGLLPDRGKERFKGNRATLCVNSAKVDLTPKTTGLATGGIAV